MRTRNLTSSACALLLTAGLAACGQTGDGPAATDAANNQPAPSAPAQLSPSERASRLQAWRTATYGKDASADQAWRDRDNNRPLHRYQCLDEAVEIAGIQHSLLAVCANRDDAAADETGLLDLWLLRADANGGLQTVDGRRGITLGSGGVVGELSLVALGPDIPGVAIQAGVGDANQAMQGETVLVAVHQDQLRQVARFASHYDNQAQLQCEDAPDADAPGQDNATDDSERAAPATAVAGADCEAGLRQLRTTWQADNSSQRDGFWPLLLAHSGVACGSAVMRNLRLDYDPGLRHYSSPDLDNRCP